MKKFFEKAVCSALAAIMTFGMMPLTAHAYHDAPAGSVADSTETEYTIPAGENFGLFTGEYLDSNYDIGSDFLFVIKKGESYYAMKEVAVSDAKYYTIPAVDVTSWVSEDGKSLEVPEEPGDVAFIRYDHIRENEEDYHSGDYFEVINGGGTIRSGDETIWDDETDTVISEKLYFIMTDTGNLTGSGNFWNIMGDRDYGTFFDRTSRYMNGKYCYTEYIVDLKSDGEGGFEFYWKKLNESPVTYDKLEEVGRQGDEVEGYMFTRSCRHEAKVDHVEYHAPTCMNKGCSEYWYCHGCERYFRDEEMTQPHEAHLNPEGYFEPIIGATGHDYDGEKCRNCGLEVPVYKKITNMEQLDSLGSRSSFIFVAEYNGKTYVMDGGDPDEFAKSVDANEDGYPDIIEIDENGNNTPDVLEIDEDGNGIWDYLETNLYNSSENGKIDWYDYQYYWDELNMTALSEDVYSGNAYNGGFLGAIEVTPEADGSIKLDSEQQLCFELVHMQSEEQIEEEMQWYENEEEKAKVAAELRNNYVFMLPNVWLQPYFCWTDRSYSETDSIIPIGDQTFWNFYFYDDVKDVTRTEEVWDFETSSYITVCNSILPNNFEAKEGSVLVYSNYDMYGGIYDEWSYIELDECIRLRESEGEIDFIGGSWIYDFEIGEQVDLNYGNQVCVYLYASDVPDGHKCEFGDWTDNGDGKTHTRICSDEECGITETEDHEWDEGSVTAEPTCTETGTRTFACEKCGAEKTEVIPAKGHEPGKWSDEGDLHSRSCTCEGCSYTETEEHSWGACTQDNDKTHTKQCTVCFGTRTEEHSWDEGVVINWATHLAPGQIDFTCTECGYVKSEEQPILEEHEWGGWYGDNDGINHRRDCLCGATETEPHDWDEGKITLEPTHLEPGIITYTCSVCGGTKEEEIPVLEEHEWGGWYGDNDGINHRRDCPCGATETEPHSFGDWKENDDVSCVRYCEVCGTAEYIKFDKEKPFNATPSDNAAGADIPQDDASLIENILTEEEQSLAAKGGEVSIYLVVEDISAEVPESHASAAEEAAGEERKIGMYLDIDLFKQIGETETQITETSGNIMIKIIIPEELINTDDSVIRTYSIIRVHTDESGKTVTDIIEGKFNPEDRSFIFETDKFSTYAIAYSDEADYLSGDANGDGKITSRDATLILQYLVDSLGGKEIFIDAADFNGDGNVTSRDATAILRYLIGG